MKAILTNKLAHEGTVFKIQSTYRAKQKDGVWEVYLDHHSVMVQNETSEFAILKDGFEFSSSRVDDILSIVLTALELYGIVMSALDLLRTLLEALTDVQRLCELIFSWVSKLIEDQEAQQTFDQTLQDTKFILSLLKDRSVLVNGRHRWRRRSKTTFDVVP